MASANERPRCPCRQLNRAATRLRVLVDLRRSSRRDLLTGAVVTRVNPLAVLHTLMLTKIRTDLKAAVARLNVSLPADENARRLATDLELLDLVLSRPEAEVSVYQMEAAETVMERLMERCRLTVSDLHASRGRFRCHARPPKFFGVGG